MNKHSEQTEPAGRARRMQNVDFGNAATDYAVYRAGFPERLWSELEKLGVHIDVARAVDLGTGTGAVARALALHGASVVGVDPSLPLIDQARKLDEQAGVSVDYVTTTAEATGLETDSADLVVAGQSWWWFDVDAVMTEVSRLLVAGGQLVICSFDWLPVPGSVVEATEALIVEANSKWTLAGGTGRHPGWIPDLERGGFSDIRTTEFDDDTLYSHEAWRGRVRASAGVAATLSAPDVQRFDERMARMLADRFPDDPLVAPHRVFSAIGTLPAGTEVGPG